MFKNNKPLKALIASSFVAANLMFSSVAMAAWADLGDGEAAVSDLSDYVDNVNTTANNALTNANNAQTAATNAQNTANAAQTAANNAQNTANAAQTAANNAQNTANAAQATANEAKNAQAASIEYGHRLDNLESGYGQLSNRVDQLDSRLNQGVAIAIATAHLNPGSYDPEHKWSVGIGTGFFRSASAVATGASYQPNANMCVTFSISISGSEVGYGGGINMKL